MATYTYKCADCGNIFDVHATIREKEEGKSSKFACPKCKSKNIKQKFSAANFIKNIFKSDKTGGCCPGGGKNNKSGCCG